MENLNLPTLEELLQALQLCIKSHRLMMFFDREFHEVGAKGSEGPGSGKGQLDVFCASDHH